MEPAIGPGAAGEFEAFCTVYDTLPDLEPILAGNGKAKFPQEASARYATVLGLTVRASTADARREWARVASEAGKPGMGAVLCDRPLPQNA